jgi:hypothetical protein
MLIATAVVFAESAETGAIQLPEYIPYQHLFVYNLERSLDRASAR